jgi:hypothetical protein
MCDVVEYRPDRGEQRVVPARGRKQLARRWEPMDADKKKSNLAELAP